MDNTGADVIKAARDYIASGNWWKGSSSGGYKEEKVCAVTALARAAISHGVCDDTYRIVDFVAKFAPGEEFRSLRRLAAFNDRPNTQLRDVVALFDKALAELGEL